MGKDRQMPGPYFPVRTSFAVIGPTPVTTRSISVNFINKQPQNFSHVINTLYHEYVAYDCPANTRTALVPRAVLRIGWAVICYHIRGITY